jgi:hypothetical protein
MKKYQENKIQKAVLDYLSYYSKVYPIYFFRANVGSFIIKDRFFKTGKKGCPDIICCKDGIFIGLEIKKSVGGIQSDHQKIAEKEIVSAGGKYYLINETEQVRALFPMD